MKVFCPRILMRLLSSTEVVKLEVLRNFYIYLPGSYSHREFQLDFLFMLLDRLLMCLDFEREENK
jgi:hypothetical protein